MVKVYALDIVSTAYIASSGHEKGKSVMVGVLLLFDFPINVLFCTGTSHFFIMSALVDSLGHKPDILHENVLVANPIESSTRLIYHNFKKLVIQCRVLIRIHMYLVLGYGL